MRFCLDIRYEISNHRLPFYQLNLFFKMCLNILQTRSLLAENIASWKTRRAFL